MKTLSLKPPLPINEAERLQALRSYDILDTPPEQGFDRITQLATRVFNVPVAFVSLMDENRQWLKSCIGLGDLKETRREIAFCAYTILQNEVLVIPDTQLDERFAEHPLVLDLPNIRFYAGAPLRTAEGFAIGTLCLVDTQPRTINEQEISTLKDLASIVVDELELRRTSRSLRDEVEERRAAEKQLEELATRDVLTGLFNRAKFNEALEEAMAQAHEQRPAMLLYVDLDSFKIVNDSLGHGAGDRLLKQISALLRNSTRPSDVVARLGGDEFALILNNVDTATGLRIAERLRAQLQEFSFTEGGRTFIVGGSIGVTAVVADIDRETLLANADAACYAAKARGRNRVELYQNNPEEIQQLRDQTDMVAKLHSALQGDRFEMWLQPVVDLTTGETLFHEALLRMRGEDGELVMPGQILPAAIRFGLMPELDRRMVKLCAAFLKRTEDTLLFVNLSATALNNPDLMEEMRGIFASAEVSPRRVVFEITETEVIRSIDLARQVITQLRSAGFRFALDDFGSGLSNLSYLKTLPLDFLKIDGSFVKDIDTDKTNLGFVKALTDIAKNLGIETVAEHVETWEALIALRKIGVTYGQGYYFGKPEPVLDHGMDEPASTVEPAEPGVV